MTGVASRRIGAAPVPAEPVPTELTVTVSVRVDDLAATAVADRLVTSLRTAFAFCADLEVSLSDRRRPAEPEIVIDLAARTIRSGSTSVALTRKEFDLLVFLVRGKGTVHTRPALLRAVWHTDDPSSTRTVDVHIRRLRAKLGPGGALISTVRGFGYRVDETMAERVLLRRATG